eukprot:SAG31_NODE_2995_length_4804_cov_9.959192_5_plen_45_part_01
MTYVDRSVADVTVRWRVTDAPGGNHSQAMIGYETEIRIILNSNLN